MSLIEVDSEPDEPDHPIDRDVIVLVVTSVVVLAVAVVVGVFLG